MRRKKTILAVVVAASLSLLLVLTRIGYLPAFLPEIPSSLPAPDLSFLKPYGINISFGELLVLAGAAFLFLVIGVGLGRAAVPQEKKSQPKPTTKPAPVKSEVKSAPVRSLMASPQAGQSKSLSAEDRLSRWLKERA